MRSTVACSPAVPLLPAPSASPDAAAVITGSYMGDTLAGSSGDDALAGMAGNDHISGGLGTNLLYGGHGQDTLVSSGFADLLAGGADADTYIIEDTGSAAFVREQSGVDRVEFARDIADYRFFRDGDMLQVIHAGGGDVAAIEGQFAGGGGRVEVMRFAGIDYSASYVESLVEGEPPSDSVCFVDGQWVMDCSYAPPIVIDLDGDGVLGDNPVVAFDIDGDGRAERLSWVRPTDAILVYDRDGDGRVSGINEISFIDDLRGARTDLEGLLAHDTDRDGAITAADAVFSSLYLWLDRNSDGVSQDGELVSLADFGIDTIELEIAERRTLDAGRAESQVLGQVTAKGSGGSYTAYDVALWFEKDPSSCGCGTASGSGSDPQNLYTANAIIGG